MHPREPAQRPRRADPLAMPSAITMTDLAAIATVARPPRQGASRRAEKTRG